MNSNTASTLLLGYIYASSYFELTTKVLNKNIYKIVPKFNNEDIFRRIEEKIFKINNLEII